MTIIDRTENAPGHESVTLSINLSAGHYVLVSNNPGDYYQGMYADLTVEGK